MRSLEAKIERVIIGKIEPEEDLIEAISEMVKKHNIQSGLVNCIGALKKFTIGYFNLESKKYEHKTFDEYIELVSCLGNVSYKDGEPHIHLHISIGTREYTITGGHLMQPSVVSITGEVYIFEIDQKLDRIKDPETDLYLLNI